jgi:membrane associated rhomboid family serine protease
MVLSQGTELFKQGKGFVDENMRDLQMLLNVPLVGASGAIFGVLLAFGVLFPNTQLMLIFPPIPIKAKFVVLAYGAIELYLAVTSPGSDIAHTAHLGGMLFGYIMIRYWRKTTNTLY